MLISAVCVSSTFYSVPDEAMARVKLLLVSMSIFFALFPRSSCFSFSGNVEELREKRQACELTVTEVNGDKSCREKVILEDNFDGPQLNTKLWTPDNMIAGFPDYEFVHFTPNETNLFIRDGLLYLKPIVVSPKEYVEKGTLDLRQQGCTGASEEECYHVAFSSYILPPVTSARIRSKGKFSFKYGIVEMRVKMPEGFWLYPEIYLEPATDKYRDTGGRMVIAQSRGNMRLLTEDGNDVGARRLITGLQLGPEDPLRALMLRRKDLALGKVWNDNFRYFKFTWLPSGVKVEVDGKTLGEIAPPRGGFKDLQYVSALEETAWSKGTSMAPFDEEFYIVLGVGVGGLHAFPDNVSSAGIKKPWKNGSVKAKSEFHSEKPSWKDTWAWDNAALKVDFIKVTAL